MPLSVQPVATSMPFRTLLLGSVNGCSSPNDQEVSPVSRPGPIANRPLKESRYALSYLLRELAIVNPPWVVCLGSSAASVLLGQAGLKMSDINGRILTWDSRKLFVTYHPSPLNYNNPQRRHHLVSDFEI